ncbi:MAG: Gfo/Idh/MocA family protein [Planctomycetota bacterium]|jgi:predicted dehydrogenase
MDKIKIGVVGLGFTGRIHALNALAIPYAQLQAVAEPEPSGFQALEEEVKKKNDSSCRDAWNQVQRFDTGEALLAEGDLDAVVIALPTHLHESMAIRAFEKGRHVLCEKPIALNLESADAMIEAGNKAGRLFMVAHCVRFWPEYIYMRNAILKGRFGKLMSLNMWRTAGMPDWSSDDWLLNHELSGGPLVDLHIHDMDFAYSIEGYPDRLYATGRPTIPKGGLGIVHTFFQQKFGPQIHLHAGWSNSSLPFSTGYEAWFEKGFLRYSSLNTPTLEAYEPGKSEPSHEEVPPWDAYTEELRYFLGCIKTGSEPDLCPPQSSRAALALTLKGIESIKTDKIFTRNELM